jgi:hypothetical protein
MRRVKSAPANLANMKNSKKKVISIEKKPLYFIPKKENFDSDMKKKLDLENNKKDLFFKKSEFLSYLNNFNNINYNYNTYNDKEYKKYSYKSFKSLKNNISNSINLISDAINEANLLNLEQYSIIYLLSIYFSENILKKDKLAEITNYIIITFIRYFIMLYIHRNVLNEYSLDLIDKNKDTIISIAHNLHLLN